MTGRPAPRQFAASKKVAKLEKSAKSTSPPPSRSETVKSSGGQPSGEVITAGPLNQTAKVE